MTIPGEIAFTRLVAIDRTAAIAAATAAYVNRRRATAPERIAVRIIGNLVSFARPGAGVAEGTQILPHSSGGCEAVSANGTFLDTMSSHAISSDAIWPS